MNKITCDINPYVYALEENRHELKLMWGEALLALLNVTFDEIEDIELELTIIVSQLMAYRKNHTPQDI
jgi:hypothetical protein